MNPNEGWIAVVFGAKKRCEGAIRRAAERRWARKRARAQGGQPGEQNAKAQASAWAKRARAVAAVATFPFVLIVIAARHWRVRLPLLAVFWIGSCALRATDAAALGDTLWVDWAATRPLLASEGSPDGRALEASREKTWLKAMKTTPGRWRPATASDLTSNGESKEMGACLLAGRCAWLRASWRQAFKALLVGGEIEWRASALDAGAGLPGLPAAQRAAQREGSRQAYAPWGGQDIGAGLFGLLLGGLFSLGLAWAADGAKEAAETSGARDFSAVARAAQGGRSAVFAALGLTLAFGAMPCFFPNKDARWVEPMAVNLAQQTPQSLSQAVGWQFVSAKDAAADFAALPGDSANRESQETPETATRRCEKAQMCAAAVPARKTEVWRFFAFGEDPRAIDAQGRSNSAWGWRRQAAAIRAAWAFVVGGAAFGVFACFAALMAAVCGSDERGRAWQRRMAALAREGAPEAERRALLAAARKRGKAAAAAAGSEGAQAPGVGGKKRKTSRL